MSDASDDPIKVLLAAANRAEQELVDAVVDLCPGEHQLVQHRDRLPPWCNVCGRTKRGAVMHHKET